MDFPLKLKDGYNPILIDEEVEEKQSEKFRKSVSKLSDEELYTRSKFINKQPGKRPTVTNRFERSEAIVEYALRWAKGICQLCENDAPFVDKNGNPYLHVHHIEWLSKGGEDSIENTVALCPNCHDKMHILNKKSDIMKLLEKVQMHINQLK